MKVAILTFSSAFNFGAVLQCYALKAVVKSLGYDVDVIDYCPAYLASRPPPYPRGALVRHPLKAVRDFLRGKAHYDAYRRFEVKNFSLSPKCVNTNQLSSVLGAYDSVIVGSDQVWNTRWNGRDAAWYGNIKVRNGLHWIGYGLSAGDANFSDDERLYLKEVLPNFHFISAREKKLSNILRELGRTDVETVIDPTILASEKIWTQWFDPIINERYVLTYQGRQSDSTFLVAKSVADRIGAKIIPVDYYQNSNRNGLHTFPAGPKEFVSLVRNAQCVITNSFHGTAFSIICGTPFFTIRLNDGMDERAENMLKTFNLSERMIDSERNTGSLVVDFDKARTCIAELREKSLTWLSNVLSKIVTAVDIKKSV